MAIEPFGTRVRRSEGPSLNKSEAKNHGGPDATWAGRRVYARRQKVERDAGRSKSKLKSPERREVDILGCRRARTTQNVILVITKSPPLNPL